MLAIQDKFLEKASAVARIVEAVLSSRAGTDPAMIARWVMTRSENGSVWLFVVLDDQRLPKFEPYAAAAHHLSSSLRGMPVLLGNHTGLRYGILLSQKPELPKTANFEGWKRGVLQLGVDLRGKPVEIGYGEISHTLVAGITQFGKSNFLRLMAVQARAEGWQLALADPDGRSFPKFEGDVALICPVGKSLESSVLVIGRVQELIDQRARLFDLAGNSPDGLDEYNEWADGRAAPLQPVLVVLDEFNGLVMAAGGVRAAFAQAVTQVAWRGAKFGVRLVLAGQDFSKDIVGPVREQLTTRVCLRVANARISDVVLGKPGAERLTLPGRALTNRWGVLQTYLVPKGLLARTDKDGLTVDEQRLAAFIWREGKGRMTMDVTQKYGMGERTARRVRADWLARGLAVVRPDQDNALFLTVKPDVQAGLDGLDAAWTGLDGQAGMDGFGAVEA
jgi:hypothetical protein